VKYVLFGGSFNPIHNAHITIAESALRSGYDRVIFVPAYQNPLKAPPPVDAQHVPTADERTDMLLAAISARTEFTVDDCELRRGGLSFTIDTINDIYERYCPNGKIGLVLGEDNLASFDKWKDAAKIARDTVLLAARRATPAIAAAPVECSFLDWDQVDISSSEIRTLIETAAATGNGGGAWEQLVPQTTAAIIKKNNYYGYSQNAARSAVVSIEKKLFTRTDFFPDDVAPFGATAPFGAASVFDRDGIACLENFVRGVLPQNRFLHSRNAALLSFDLAGRFGVNKESAYIAGLTHDVCKTLSEDALLRLASLRGGISDEERRVPKLLHGKAAAAWLDKFTDIRNRDIIEAVEVHTIGAAGMGDLAKIVYIADKIEARRNTVDRNLRLLSLSATLDELFPAVVRGTVKWLEERGKAVSEKTRALYS
jgi:nicotinate-nucleotide adenylyltransferase